LIIATSSPSGNDGRKGKRLRCRQRGIRGWVLERRQSKNVLANASQWLSARGQKMYSGRSSEDSLRDLGSDFCEVLAVVEHYEYTPLAQMSQECRFDVARVQGKAEFCSNPRLEHAEDRGAGPCRQTRLRDRMDDRELS
jgi:hypothetical protein